MINNVSLTGRITKDLEKKETGKGTSVVNFSLAVDRRFKNSNGDREADSLPVDLQVLYLFGEDACVASAGGGDQRQVSGSGAGVGASEGDDGVV